MSEFNVVVFGQNLNICDISKIYIQPLSYRAKLNAYPCF
jgi:hypothetical protein